MDYNKSVKKVIVPYIMDNIIGKVDNESESWNLTINSYRVKESNKPFDYFKNEGKSCSMELIIDYTVSPKNGDKSLIVSGVDSLFIPQIIKSSFIIEGKARTHESYFDKGEDLNIQKDKISFKGCTYRVNEGNINFYIRGLGNQLMSVDDITDSSKFKHPEFEKTLILSERQRKKIRIIYGFDPGKKLTKDVLVRMGDSFKYSMRDHAVTKQLITVDRAFFMHIEKIAFKMVRNISAQFYKSGALHLKTFQSSINNFFKARSESVNSVHFPDNINELTYLIASKKVILETGADHKKELKVSKTRYNHTFFEIVDPAVSPDGKNINKKNELAQAVEVNSDGSVNIKVYDKNFKKVSIEFLDYMLSKVLHYEEVNYVEEKVISSKGPYKLKYKGEIIEDYDFDYIDLHPDERLATTSRQIPMMSSCDSIRVSMGAKMLAQAITTKTSEPPLIATGYENIKDDSPLALKWDKDFQGKVIKSDTFNGIIEIETPEKKIEKVKIPSAINSMKDLSISFTPAKVGTILKKGDLVYRSSNMAQDGQLRLGQNLLTAFMYWRGLDFEDSVIVSESASKKMTTYGEHIIEYNIKPGEKLNRLMEPGTMIDSRDRKWVVSVNKKLTSTRSQEGLNNLVRVNREYTKEVGIKVPSNMTNAIIVDVQYVEFIPDSENSKILKDVCSLNYKSSPKSDYNRFVSNFGEPDNVRKLSVPTEFEKGDIKGIAYKVYIKIALANVCKAGDKVTNRFGSKGVLADIIPDSEMPRTLDGDVIDVILNPSSVIARKNLPQTSEVVLSKISEELWTRIENMPKETKEQKDTIKNLLSKYHFYWLSKMKWKEFIKYHDSKRDSKTKYQVRTGSYSPYSPQRVAEIQEELDVKDKVTLIDGKRNRKIKVPIMVGYSYILKLHHMADYNNKVTTDNPRDRNPMALGLGLTRSEGQVIGEMESMALITHGVTDYLRDVRGNTKSDWFLANMILSSQVIVDKKGKALLTEVSNTRTNKNNYR